MQILTPKKYGVALDVDGTLADTNRECYARVQDAWYSRFHLPFPLDYDQFRSFRPGVKRVEDYFTLSARFMQHDAFIESPPLLTDEGVGIMTATFYDKRKEKQAQDMPGWLSENPAYDGAAGMMQALSATGWDVFAVTSKDEASVRALLDHHKLAGVSQIFDRETGKNRKEQFGRAASDRGVELGNTVAYDDLLPQLLEARENSVHPIWAPQGYGVKADIEAAGIQAAWPNEFVAAVEEVFRQRGHASSQ